MSKANDTRKEAKRKVVVARLNEAHSALDVLSGMWDESVLDALVLAFGLGHVELTK